MSGAGSRERRPSSPRCRVYTTASPTLGALDEAIANLASFRQMDVRIREHMTADRLLLASDLLYADALELAREAVGHVAAAHVAERAARDASVAADRQSQGIALMVAAGASLLVALLLLAPVRTARENTDAESVASETTATEADGLADAASSAANSDADLDGADAGSTGEALDLRTDGLLGLSRHPPRRSRRQPGEHPRRRRAPCGVPPICN